MKHFQSLIVLGLALAGLAMGGCGAKDPSQPQTLQQQADMARGFEPTKEQLAAAMSRYKTPSGTPAIPNQPGTKP